MSQPANRYSEPEPLGQKLVIVATSDLPRGVTSAIASGTHHRIDYLELARQHGSPYFDYSGLAQNLWRKMEQLIKLDFRLAFQVKQFADRTKAQVIACLSERVGIPLALFRPRAKIVVVAHNPFSLKKYPLIARLADRWDAISLFSRAEADEFARRVPGIAHRLHVIPPSIDTDFYRPTAQPAAANQYAYSIGLMHRDYPVLAHAFEQLPETLTCLVCAASLWDKGRINWGRKTMPINVRQHAYSGPPDVREKAGRSFCLIVPIRLANLGWNDGCTSVTLAGAMGKAVVATATPGLSELVRKDETGLIVPPRDPQALAGAISYLWQHPEVANEMGRRARLHAESVFSHAAWLSQISKLLYQVGN